MKDNLRRANIRMYVGGVNASGKSSLLRKFAELSEIPVIHATGLLMERLGCSNDYEALRRFTQNERDVALGLVMQSLLENQNSFVVDGHYLSLVEGQTNKITGPWLRKFDAIGLISAPTETIIKRIESDLSIRDRSLFPKGCSKEEERHIFEEYQDKTDAEFSLLMRTYGLPGIRILNDSDYLDEATLSLQSFISDLRKGASARM